MYVAFKLKDEFAAAAGRKDFSSPALAQLRSVLKDHGLDGDMSPFFANEEKPDVFCTSAKKYAVHHALQHDRDFQDKIVAAVAACEAVEKAFLRPMMN
jgi:hypothetical protein